MAKFSIRLAQESMVDILKIKVRFKRTRSGFTTYTDKRHHGISADVLAIKWGIGLDKAKRTLQPTIQYNVISAQKPLTRWYRTDFLPQRLCRLYCRFYTDTLFTKDKSIVGNTCAQIFTDWGFIQIIPIRSKSEGGTKIDSINRDVGIVNEIFLENAPEQTVYNKEMQRMARLTRMEVQTTEPYSLWQNKAESVIKIIKGKANRRRFQKNTPKWVWYFGMVYEADIYSRTAFKDECQSLE